MRVLRAALLGVACTCLVALLGCGAVYWPPPKQTAKPEPSLRSQLESAPQPYNLPHVEILQYQGQRLDEVAKEPENSIKGPQHIDVNTYRLKVGGLVRTPLSLTYQDVIHMPAYQKVTTLNCVEGWSVRYLWQGVLLSDILDRAGADPNAKVIIFRCYDGYSTSLSADYIRSNKILLAYMMNQIYMPAERGFPFQVVAENQYGYKWAKWVTQIEVSNDVNFRGYWETRGYDNTATLQGAP